MEGPAATTAFFPFWSVNVLGLCNVDMALLVADGGSFRGCCCWMEEEALLLQLLLSASCCCWDSSCCLPLLLLELLLVFSQKAESASGLSVRLTPRLLLLLLWCSSLFCLTDSGLMYWGSEANSSSNCSGAGGGGGSVGVSRY